MMRRLRVLLAAAFLAGFAPPQPVPKGDPRIIADPAALEADMAFLADDLLEGREAGKRGDALAQLYLASRFAALGLRPAGDPGSYIQRFRVRATRLDLASVNFRVLGARERSFDNGGDVAMYGSPLEARQQVEAPLAFAGYGIASSELGIDDYAGLDVRGRIVLLLGGPPPFLPAAEAAHFGSTEQQRREAERHGAIGVIHLWTPALEQRFPFDGLKSILGRTDLHWLGPAGTPNVTAPAIRFAAFARGEAAAALLDGGPKSLAALIDEAKTGSPRGFALPSRVAVARTSLHDDGLATANVAALLPGSDPRLREEFVVLTAHYDHVGIGAAVNGDTIYNGALDNAVGTAMLLDVARALKAAPPKRSVLFVAVGAEEKGLIGSDYFAERPTVPAASIVANINLDGAMPFYDFADVIAFGAEQSELGGHLTAAAARLGLTAAPDPFPEEGIFARSDQYSFVKRGVPSTFLYIGFTDMSGRNVGRRMWDELGETIVHKPADDLSQPIDYAVVAKFAEVFRRLTIEVADAPVRPRWYRDSIFGAQFAPDAPKMPR